jgi:ABC-type multidrug transport system ATPase subunit
MTSCISAQHVRKAYGDSVALADVSFELDQGEIVALLGPNGAGKTTFVKILATLLAKDSGQVSILGYDIDRHEREVRHLFGYVGQDTDRSAYPRLSAAQNLRFFGALRGLTRRQVDARIDKLATYFDFNHQLDKEFMQLSGGQKQTVVVMRALLHDPAVVYLDEPTKGLDVMAAKRLRSFLKDYVHGERKSILLTTHILTEVEELASRVALMHAGRIGITDTPAGLRNAVGATEFIEILRDDLPHPTRQRILGLEPVLFVLDADPTWTAFAVRDPFDGAEAILRTLRQDGVVAKFRLRTASLEDAFVYHMGVLGDKFD